MFTYQIDREVSLALPTPEKDAAPLFDLLVASQNEIAPWLPWVKSMKSPKDEQIFLENAMQHFIEKTSLNVVILYHDEIVGMISFNRFSWFNKNTEIGYWLGTDFSGKGIIQKAIQGMCNIGFEEYDLHKITIHAAVENTRSNKTAERAGFTLDGTLRQQERLADGYHDENVWSLTKSEWEASPCLSNSAE
ncbi:GNAT family protein [Fructobacillus cardui]|uniref:RimJ/RimL family (RimL) n=1 Tax=Fructobacillus cardui TaxID=2893170 RepID=A0ABM9MLK7_9LACO|nr:Protein N-acetyltransferase [Fructobacillus cardui]